VYRLSDHNGHDAPPSTQTQFEVQTIANRKKLRDELLRRSKIKRKFLNTERFLGAKRFNITAESVTEEGLDRYSERVSETYTEDGLGSGSPFIPTNDTIAASFGGDASLPSLDYSLSEMTVEEEVIDTDEALSDDTEIDDDDDAAMDSSLPPIILHADEPTVGDLDMLPPSFASIHKFTRPLKEKMGSRFNKESRRQIAKLVRSAIEDELQSEYWV
jgi:hypothetical protein